jgi:hypothetical protein
MTGDVGTASVECPRCGDRIMLVIGMGPAGPGRLTVTATIPLIERDRHRHCTPRSSHAEH